MFWILIVLLVIPAIQKEFPLIKIKDLNGDFILAEKPGFSFKAWMDGDFQTKSDKYIEEHIGFRNFLVRMINQIDFSLFRTVHAEGVVVGKKDQMFEFDYIRACTGGDFIGEKIIDYKIRKLKFLQEHLKAEKNIDLILVFEPAKSSFYPEYIPNRYFNDSSNKTNYRYFTRKAQEYDIEYINFNTYYQSLKDKKPYPLYPRYGIHWSTYGMSFIADSMLKYIEALRNIDMNEVYIDSIEVESAPRSADFDIGVTLNLLCPLPQKEPLAYPVYRFEENPAKDKPSVLVIGDSYYWNIFNTMIPKYLFKNEAFWYFYAKVYPDTYYKETWVKDLNLKAEIEKQDVIFLMVTERFLHKFGWNFIEEAYSLYGPVSRLDILHNKKCGILGYSEWLNSDIQKAKDRNVSLEEMLELDAGYVYSLSNINELLTLKGPAYLENSIRQDNNWLSSLRTKAEEKKISLSELIHQNAVYQMQTSYKAAYDNYMKISEAKEAIMKDSLLFSETKEIARKYYLTMDEAMQVKSEQMTQLSPEKK